LRRPRRRTTTRQGRACAARSKNLQAAAAGWSGFWAAVDKRIAETIAAQYTFAKDQQELLFDILNDAHLATREQISKAIDEAQRAVDARFETLERRVRAPGALPPVKAWRQGIVVYEGELAVFGGEVFQARTDTGLQPGDPEAWVCVARAGRDAVPIVPRGEWSASVSYGSLNLVTYRDRSYLATRDNPGRPSLPVNSALSLGVPRRWDF
jgi:hypothetical protein